MRWLLWILLGVALAGCANTPENKARQTITGLDLITEYGAKFVVVGNKSCADKAVAYGRTNGVTAGRDALVECSKRRTAALAGMQAALNSTSTAIPALEAAIAIKSGNYDALLLPAIVSVCAFRKLLTDLGVNVPNPAGVCS